LNDRRDDAAERAREEFFSEASELVETFGRHLLGLEEALEGGSLSEPERLNDIFRAVHTLKGLAGLFGAVTLSGLSHELETLLDDLRLGRIPLSAPVLDLLFDAVEIYGQILSAQRGDRPEPREAVDALLASLATVSNDRAGEGTTIAEYELAPETLGVLTEYEEHRLRTNLAQGVGLYRLRARFPLSSIDTALEDLKARMKPVGEIITYLPTGDGGDLDAIELEILLASKAPLIEIEASVDPALVRVEEVRRRDLSHVRTPPAPRVAARASMPPPRVPSIPPAPLTPDRASFFPDDEGDDPEPRDLRTDLPPQLVAPPPQRSATLPPVEDRRPVGPGPDAPQGLGGARDLSLRSVSQTVRVDIRKLDRLMNTLGELSLVRGALLRYAEGIRKSATTRRIATDLLAIHRSFERQLAQMQSGILEVRMVPLGQVFDKLARIVRQVSREQGKATHFVVTGAETEIDKLIVEELSDPLLHIIRNALDHGIESPDERRALGKPEAGTIVLNAYQQGNHVVIEVEDDGRGIDAKRVLEKAIENKLIGADEAEGLSQAEALRFIFQPGLSTRDQATELSGRGIGMDIVKSRITKLGGVVDVSSDLNIGTQLTLTLPVTLAIVGVLTFEVAGVVYCVPLSTMEEAVLLEGQTRWVEGREVLTHRGVSLPIVRLGEWFASRPRTAAPTKQFLIVARVGARRLGLVVDGLNEQREVVIKALGRALADVAGFSGATDLGDQRIALILDVSVLMDELFGGVEARRTQVNASSAGDLS
jgi:two-component system chemotaxis sensor kinase CheA